MSLWDYAELDDEMALGVYFDALAEIERRKIMDRHPVHAGYGVTKIELQVSRIGYLRRFLQKVKFPDWAGVDLSKVEGIMKGMDIYNKGGLWDKGEYDPAKNVWTFRAANKPDVKGDYPGPNWHFI